MMKTMVTFHTTDTTTGRLISTNALMMKVFRAAANIAAIIGINAISTTTHTDIKLPVTAIIQGAIIGSIGSTDPEPYALVTF